MQIVIKAPQGAGKTTIAQKLVDFLHDGRKIKTQTTITVLEGSTEEHVKALSEIKPDVIIFDECLNDLSDVGKAESIANAYKEINPKIITLYLVQK